MKKFGVFLFGILVIFINGAAISLLWNWYVVDQFKMQSLSVKNAIGLALLISIIKIKPNEFDDDDAIEKITIGCSIILVALLLGYIAKVIL